MENFIQNHVLPQHIENPGIFGIQGIFIILPNIYHDTFYSKPCLTLTYSEPYTFKTLVYFETKPYSEPCRIPKMDHFIKKRVQVWHIQTPDIFKTFVYSELERFSYSLMYQLFFRTTNLLLLLYPLLFIKSMPYS